jgi:hypothetical protein
MRCAVIHKYRPERNRISPCRDAYPSWVTLRPGVAMICLEEITLA